MNKDLLSNQTFMEQFGEMVFPFAKDGDLASKHISKLLRAKGCEFVGVNAFCYQDKGMLYVRTINKGTLEFAYSFDLAREAHRVMAGLRNSVDELVDEIARELVLETMREL